MASELPQSEDGDGEGKRKIDAGILTVRAPAAAHIREYLARQGKTGSAIRVEAVRTHCMGGRGFGYSIREDASREGDTVVEGGGLNLLVDSRSLQYLTGASIDFEESVQGSGLIVRNPSAVGKCHCGRHDIFDTGQLESTHQCGPDGD